LLHLPELRGAKIVQLAVRSRTVHQRGIAGAEILASTEMGLATLLDLCRHVTAGTARGNGVGGELHARRHKVTFVNIAAVSGVVWAGAGGE
jgi:hypothetical protein